MAKRTPQEQAVAAAYRRIKSDTLIIKENPFSKHSGAISRTYRTDLNHILRAPSDDTIKLALVSLHLGKPQEMQVYANAYVSEACKRTLLRVPDYLSLDHMKSYKNVLDEVLSLEPNIVCMNEFAFPEEHHRPRPEAIRFTKRRAKASHSIILAGSYHDADTYYNTGLLFYPSNKRAGVAYQHFFKNVTACEMGEVASVPSIRLTPAVQAFGIEIHSVICLDFLDYSAIAGVVKDQIASLHSCRILLVAALTNMMDTFQIMCQYISRMMSGVVAIANHCDPAVMSSLAFKFGKAMKPVLNKEPNGALNRCIKLYEINLKELEREAKENFGSLTPGEKWMFGSADGYLD